MISPGDQQLGGENTLRTLFYRRWRRRRRRWIGWQRGGGGGGLSSGQTGKSGSGGGGGVSGSGGGQDGESGGSRGGDGGQGGGRDGGNGGSGGGRRRPSPTGFLYPVWFSCFYFLSTFCTLARKRTLMSFHNIFVSLSLRGYTILGVPKKVVF